MIRNPYAKKRPRPSGWTSESSSSAPVGNHQLDPSGPRDAGRGLLEFRQNHSHLHPDGPRGYKENVKHQTYDSNLQNALPNDFQQSKHPIDRHSTNGSTTHTNAQTMASTEPIATSQPLQTPQRNSYTKDGATNFNQNGASASAKRTLASAMNYPSRKSVFNPYARKGNTEARISNPSRTLPIPYQNVQQSHTRKQSDRNAKISDQMGSRTVPAKSGSDSSMYRNQPKASGSAETTTLNCKITSNPRAKLPPSMASIRPASWKSTGGNLDGASFQPANSSTNNASISTQQKLTTQYSTTVQHSNQSKLGKVDEHDRLPPELSYTADEVKPIQDEFRMPLIKNANLSSPLKNGWTLFPHQKKAIIRALTMRRMILALDMGLGKTLIGSVWSKAFKDTFGEHKLKVFVVCPVSLKEEWQRTAEEAVGLEVDGPEKGKSKGKGKKSIKRERNSRGRSMKMTISSWAKVPKAVEPDVEHFVVCCDEAHAMQSTQAQRTKDILSLVSDKRCVGVLLLTGTPMKNGKPGNLFPLLKAVRHPLGRHQKAYEAHFCNGMLKNFGRGPQWDASGASNLDQLKRKVASNLLHMTKEQCLKELPPMTTIFHDVPVSSRFQMQYEQSIKYLASVQANASNMRDEAVLGAVQRLRVVCAHAKVQATVELARSVLNKEPAVVIFTYFAQVAKNVHTQLKTSGWPCSLLTGETPQNKRQELVDKFQKGLSSVFVCTFGAGGVGLTLTAASTIILLDRPWTPGETRQAEDRIRRIGQVKKCTSYWMRSFDLDKQIDAVVESKKQTTDAVLDKSKKHINATTSSKISINQLVHKFVLSEARKKL